MNEERKELRLNPNTLGEKAIGWFKTNILTLIVALVSLAYIIFGLVGFDPKEQSLLELIGNTALGIGVGVTINMLLGKIGISKGLVSAPFLNTKKTYGQVVDDISTDIDKLDDFCDKKVEQIRERKIRQALKAGGLLYDRFIKGEYNSDNICPPKPKNTKASEYKRNCKIVRGAYEKALRVKVYNLNATSLISEIDEDKETDKPEQTINKYETIATAKNLTTKILFALVFAYFGVGMIEDASWANVIWHAFQIALWLSFGVVRYFQDYSYITMQYRQKIIRKTNYLIEFREALKVNPNAFKAKVYVQETPKMEPVEIKPYTGSNPLKDIEEE